MEDAKKMKKDKKKKEAEEAQAQQEVGLPATNGASDKQATKDKKAAAAEDPAPEQALPKVR